MNVYGHTATSVVHALQWLPQRQGRIETQTVKNKTSNYWQSWVSHTCWSSPKEKEMTRLGVYDYECLIWKVFFVFGHAEPMWNHSSPTRDWTTPPALGAESLNHWTTSKVLRVFFFFFLTALCFAECFSHLWVHLSTAPSNDRGKPCWLCCLAFREGVPSMSHAGLLSEWNDTLSILFLCCLFISLMNIVRGHRRKWENIEK